MTLSCENGGSIWVGIARKLKKIKAFELFLLARTTSLQLFIGMLKNVKTKPPVFQGILYRRRKQWHGGQMEDLKPRQTCVQVAIVKRKYVYYV